MYYNNIYSHSSFYFLIFISYFKSFTTSIVETISHVLNENQYLKYPDVIINLRIFWIINKNLGLSLNLFATVSILFKS